MKQIDEKMFKEICNQSLSMAEASVKLGLHFNTFKKYALKLNCYYPNPSGKGISKNFPPKIDLDEIIEGNHPYFNTHKLKNRLFKAQVLENKCSICGITEWNGIALNMELHHKDGNRCNHKIENLEILCPNCHAQTATYRSKKRNGPVA